jgi:hypothetical protein
MIAGTVRRRFVRGRSQPMTRYEIRVEGVLDERWSSWFSGLEIRTDERTTTLVGSLPDQAALEATLARLFDLGLVLISVRRLDPE